MGGGFLFGALGGTLWGTAGTTLGAVITFGAARSLGREMIERRWARLGHLARERGYPWLAVTTALPVTPLTPTYSAAGLSGMRFAPFVAATVAGLVPRVTLFSLFGAWSIDPSWAYLVTASLLGVVLVCLALVVRRFLGRRARPLSVSLDS